MAAPAAAMMCLAALLRIVRAEHPPGEHVGHVHSPGELSFEDRAAVGDGVDLEEPWSGLGLVASSVWMVIEPGSSGPALVALIPRTGSLTRAGARYRSMVAALIATRLGPHGGRVAGLVARAPHGAGAGRAAGGWTPPGTCRTGRPYPLQDLQGVIGILTPPGGNPPHVSNVPRTPPGGLGQGPTRTHPAPTGHRAHLVKHPALVALRRLGIRRSILPGDLSPGPHQAARFPCPQRSTNLAGTST